MDRSDLYTVIERKIARVVLQARAMLERGLVNELPYDATDLAYAGLGMIVASFRNACYHRDSIIIPKLGTFRPVDNSVQFVSELSFNVLSKMFSKLGVLTEEEQREFNAGMRELHAKMTIGELKPDTFLDMISEQLAPLYLSASPQEITETILSTWEDIIVSFLKMGWRVHILGIGKFSFDENEIQKVVFTPDDVLIHAIQAGDYRRNNRHLYSEDS